MEMHKQTFTSSNAWIAYFNKNTQTATAARKTFPDCSELSDLLRSVVAGSLPAWQLGETSDGRHLRAAARQYAEAQGDPDFVRAVELFIGEEQRHGAALGEWLDLAGIPRKSRDLGDSLFRFCRYTIPNYAVWASVVVMVESMAQIYYAAVRRLSPCPRLKSECKLILCDEVKHIQFQCEHLAAARRRVSPLLRLVLTAIEAPFYAVVCTAVWIAHGRLLRAADIPLGRFRKMAIQKFCVVQAMMDPERYDFGEAPKGAIAPVKA